MKADEIIQPSLLLIPDISGFTRFLNETEVIHGSHIVAELLELIINENKLGLKVAEIEGDAIFFYRHGEKPTLKELFNQCKLMFIAFHQHIKLYEKNRICNCGSCSTTPELTLKFVIHHGNIIQRKIMGFLQLMGPDVIVAHKLMKNEIETHEYILITDTFFTNDDQKLIEKLNFKKAQSSYENIGTINYSYSYLSELLNQIPETIETPIVFNGKPLIHIEKKINATLEQTHTLLKDLTRKKDWVLGLKEVKFDQTKIFRIGTVHECLLPGNKLNIATIENKVEENKITYTEQVISGGFLPKSKHVFTIEPITDNQIKLSLDIYLKNTFINRFFFKNVMKNSFSQSLQKLKKLLEIEN